MATKRRSDSDSSGNGSDSCSSSGSSSSSCHCYCSERKRCRAKRSRKKTKRDRVASDCKSKHEQRKPESKRKQTERDQSDCSQSEPENTPPAKRVYYSRSKRHGVVYVFPGCERLMQSSRFKKHFQDNHLCRGEEYALRHRREYEIGRRDARLLDNPFGLRVFVAGSLERIEARLVLMERTHQLVGEMHERMKVPLAQSRGADQQEQRRSHQT